MKKPLVEMKNKHKMSIVRKIIYYAVVVVLVLSFALFCRFVPLKMLLPAYAFPERADGELRVHFLSVGEGDCSIIEYPDGKILVIDAGDGLFGHNNKLIRYIKGLAPDSISAVVTHLDSDHSGGMEEVLACFQTQTLYLPVADEGEAVYRKLAAAAQKCGTATQTLSRYDVLEHSSGAYGVCISPYSIEESGSNDASAVIYFCYSGVGFLFSGDVSSVRERRIMRDYALIEGIFDSKGYAVRLEDTQILKVSHHGSGNASCEEWLELLSPQEAIISCGVGNIYRHPEVGVIERLEKVNANIRRCDELGDIIVSVRDGEYKILTEK